MEPTAMTLSTATRNGKPSSRVVLLKGFDAIHGFMFYTNYESRKAQEIKDNPHASILFYWPDEERQIRVEGKIKKLPKPFNETYFHQRPRSSRIGAWSSAQSKTLRDRKDLDHLVELMGEYFGDVKPIPLPPFWGGYGLAPSYFEFWQGRPSRLHDRMIYKKVKTEWKIERLYP